MRVVAADRGDPPLWAEVDVELDVVDRNNKPPLWDLTNYGPIYVKENVTVGTVVTSVKARSVAQMHITLSLSELSTPSRSVQTVRPMT